jgi:signal transduction histidine kinase
MATFMRSERGSSINDDLYDWVAYITLVVGYLLTIFQAWHLTPSNFFFFTASNIAWLWAFRQAQAGPCWQRNVWPIAIMLAATVAALLMVQIGLNFDWLLPIIMVAVLASLLSVRLALGMGVGLLVVTLGIMWSANGSSKYFVGLATALVPAFIFVFAFSYATRRQQEERQRAEGLLAELTTSNAALATAHAQLQQYAGEIEELAVTRERNRMARDIHDTLGHYLTILALQLETATKLEERHDASLHAELVEARRVATECLAEVRHSVAALRPADPTAASFGAALQQLVAEFEAVSPTTVVTLDQDDAAQDLAPEIRLALYRVVQEALTNIRKHAHATKVLLRLRVGAEQADLSVLDNGIGAASATNEHAAGFGLVGMRERLALLGGTVVAQPTEDQGWRVDVTVPTKAQVIIPIGGK